MNFDDLWNELVKQQPRLAEGSKMITFTVPGFRLILKQVYDRGKADTLQVNSGLGWLLNREIKK